MRRRVGLLTGTFDPVHLGHVALARAAMGACDLREVWFLVNPAPGHKTGVVPAADRVAMVQLALEGERRMREGDPDDVGVVRHRMADFDRLTGAYPGTEFVFIVGADVLAAMARWEDQEPVLERARFAVARRAGAPEAAMDSRLQVQVFEVAEHAAASSRVVQGQLAAGERPSELDPRVLAYIRERGLYVGVAQAVPDDAAGIAAVQHEAWLATYPNEALGIPRAAIEERVKGFRSPERIAKWRDIIGNHEEYVVVAKDDHRVVGFGCGKRREDGVGEVTALYILSRYHGTGAAHRLMEAVMGWLEGVSEVRVEVASYNARAIAFYERYGFGLTGETSSSDVIPTVFMRHAKLPIS
ncbi:MAG TPA: GNAT family N-acetyltransferase [Candidatus Saccharimonadia bacterium]|nr:GNAT family N-acetyltransferase [Candidatus Saccharimonadia bacterium]